MRKIYFIISLFCLILALGAGCNKTDLTPAYIYITEDDVNNRVDISTFNADHDLYYDEEQLNSLQQHSFTHVNVYVNNKNLGCWQLPCKVPVLDVNGKDSSKLVIIPCFRKTGMSVTIKGYPFFDVLQQKIMLKRGETYNVSDNPLSFRYSKYSHFPFHETFANSSSFSPIDTAEAHSFYPTVIDDRQVGEIVLNAGEKFDVISTAAILPIYNYTVYLEITYKTESNIDIGLKMSTGQYPNTVHQIGGIYESGGEWKTIYFDLSSVLMGYHYTGGSSTSANIVLTGSGKNVSAPTHFYIDNIKIVYQPSA